MSWTDVVTAVVAVLALILSWRALRLQSKALKLSGSAVRVRARPFTDFADDGKEQKKTEITLYANGQQRVEIRALWLVTGDPSDDKCKYPKEINDVLPITLEVGHARIFELDWDIRGWADWRGSRSVAVGVATGSGEIVFSRWLRFKPDKEMADW